MIELRAGDRSGLLYALGRSLADGTLSVRSAHISTLAGQAIDTFYLTEVDGSQLTDERADQAIEALTAAAGPGLRSALSQTQLRIGSRPASSTSAAVGG